MLDDDALVARQPWDWSELVVEEFFPAVTAPNTVYIGRCRVVCRPWIIHEIAILNTAGGLRTTARWCASGLTAARDVRSRSATAARIVEAFDDRLSRRRV